MLKKISSVVGYCDDVYCVDLDDNSRIKVVTLEDFKSCVELIFKQLRSKVFNKEESQYNVYLWREYQNLEQDYLNKIKRLK